jgi:hypothetical protein
MMQELSVTLVPTYLDMTRGHSTANGAYSIAGSSLPTSHYCYFETCVRNAAGYPAIGKTYGVATSYHAYY